LLRVLASQYSAASELPAVLTAFDALGVKALSQSGGFNEDNPEVQHAPALSLGTLTSPTMLAAVVRVVLKGRMCSIDLSVDNLASAALTQYMMVEGEEEGLKSSLVGYSEAVVFEVLDGRSQIASSPEWARQILTRLNAMAQPPGRLSWELQNSVLPSVNSWADLFTERVAATVTLPPHALALGACVLGLTATGLLLPAEACPSDLPSEAWEQSLVGMLERSRSERAQEESQAEVTLHDLAEAALCDEEGFRRSAFSAIATLQMSLMEVTHPAILSAIH